MANHNIPLSIITIEQETDKSSSVLAKIAHEVQFPLADEDKKLISRMKQLLYKLEGVGLAAPQVGLGKKIALIYIPESASLLREDVRAYPMHAIINPEYSPVDSKEKRHDFEGCYSVSSIYGKVPRFSSIKVKYQNENGNIISQIVDGFYARVLQHEIDHLNGLLITDRLTSECLQGPPAKMLKFRRAELPKDKQKYFDELIKSKGLTIED